jgi:hypothetical protein
MLNKGRVYMEREKFNWINWSVLNIIVPIAPFILKSLIVWTGKGPSVSKIKIFETPELLYCSITVCIVALNINYDGQKKYFEELIRKFLGFITIADCIMLAVIYTGNEGANSIIFSIAFAVIPIIIAYTYQLNVLKSNHTLGGEASNVAS